MHMTFGNCWKDMTTIAHMESSLFIKDAKQQKFVIMQYKELFFHRLVCFSRGSFFHIALVTTVDAVFLPGWAIYKLSTMISPSSFFFQDISSSGDAYAREIRAKRGLDCFLSRAIKEWHDERKEEHVPLRWLLVRFFLHFLVSDWGWIGGKKGATRALVSPCPLDW